MLILPTNIPHPPSSARLHFARLPPTQTAQAVSPLFNELSIILRDPGPVHLRPTTHRGGCRAGGERWEGLVKLFRNRGSWEVGAPF